MIVVTVDVGGSKTTAVVTQDTERLIRIHGPGAAVRPGRALMSATTIADVIRQALAQTNLLRADAIVVGAAGAGREADAEEVRSALVRERIAGRVMVVSDVMLAFSASAIRIGAVLVAGTGSIAIGCRADGVMVRQGGFGWQMGDEGSGYWIGREALRAVGLAQDGRGRATELRHALIQAVGGTEFRDVVGWSTVAMPREVAGLSRAVVAAAETGDATAITILDRAAAELVGLVDRLAGAYPGASNIPVGLAGGLIGIDGPLSRSVAERLTAPFVPLAEPIDPAIGGPRLLTDKR